MIIFVPVLLKEILKRKAFLNDIDKKK